jgi:hypothetical protein
MNTWAFVRTVGAGAGNGSTDSITVDDTEATAGNFLISALKFFSPDSTATTFAMSITGAGNTISQTPDVSGLNTSDGYDFIGIYSCPIVSTPVSITATGTGSIGDYALDLYEFSYGGGAVSAVSPVSASGASGIGNAGTIVPTASALLFSAFTTAVDQTQAAGGGWTLGGTFQGTISGFDGIPSSLQQYILNSSSPQAATTGDAYANPWVGAGIAYQIVPSETFTLSPTSGATGVATGTTVECLFSEAVLASTINASTFTLATSGGSPVPGSVAYNSGTDTAAFTPSASLANETVYTATLTTGVETSNGTSIPSPVTWSFTTASQPPTGSGVVSEIGFQFNAAIISTNLTITATVSATSANFPGTTTYNSETFLATFTPTTPFVIGTKYIIVVSGATASDGTPMAAATFSFTPGARTSPRWFPGLFRTL